MSRPLRIQYPDEWYHVMNRGRRGESVFLENRDYSMFVEILKEVVDMYVKPRNVAIFLIKRLRGEKLEEIGRQFSIAKYSSVSSAIEKMKIDISADRRLKARVKTIEKIFQNSQKQI